MDVIGTVKQKKKADYVPIPEGFVTPSRNCKVSCYVRLWIADIPELKPV